MEHQDKEHEHEHEEKEHQEKEYQEKELYEVKRIENQFNIKNNINAENNAKIKRKTKSKVKKVENKKINNNQRVETKMDFARRVLSIIWLIINIVAVLFFADYSNSIFDLSIALSLPLNMVMLVLSFGGINLDYSDEFIK